MTRRRSLVAALAFIALVGVLLIPTASEARTSRVRLPLLTTTTVAPLTQSAAPTPAVAGAQPVTAASTFPGFSFPGFTFGAFTFPGFTTGPINVPDALDGFFAPIFTGIQGLLSGTASGLSTLLGTLCTILGGAFCASA